MSISFICEFLNEVHLKFEELPGNYYSNFVMAGRQLSRIFAGAARLRSLQHPASTMAVPRERPTSPPPPISDELGPAASSVQMHRLQQVVVPSSSSSTATDHAVAEPWGVCPARLGTTTEACPAEHDSVTVDVHVRPRPFNEIPGPKGWPFIGTLGTYLVGNGLSRIYEHQVRNH